MAGWRESGFGRRLAWAGLLMVVANGGPAAALDDRLALPTGTWVKRTPVEGAPPSPRLGYEGACAWDPFHRVLIRYGGHNQGGGGEQGAEVWTVEPPTWRWSLREPNTSPPGVCCNAQNVFDRRHGRYLRFPSFSGSHGWQWHREIYLNDSSVWTYDLAENRWRNLRPLPAPHVAPLRSATWDDHAEIAVVFGGEGGPRETMAYDPARNEWRWLKPPSQPEPRSGGQMAYDPDHRVHVLFGSQFDDDPHTWIFDVSRNEWRDARPAVQPATDRNDAVLAWDPGRRAVLAIIKRTDGEGEAARHALETWSYDAGANAWQRLEPPREPDPSGNRARQLVGAPELGVVLLENCTSEPREQQIWTWRSEAAAGATSPPPPPGPVVPPVVTDGAASVVAADRVELRWERPASVPASAGFHVERAVVEVLSEDQLWRLKRRTPPLAAPSVGAIRRIGRFEPLTGTPIAATAFTDTTVDLRTPVAPAGEAVHERSFGDGEIDAAGRPYRFAVFAYRIRVVAASGEEGGPSPPFFTIPSAPQHLFSREAGETCALKWAANPEDRIAGYRVYRMDGRWDTDPISRLTMEPVRGTSFEDPTASRATRRFHVIAVDALGQEGFPSAPVWFEREWKRFYEPFTGEWHQ